MALEIRETFRVAAPVDRVWRFLMDPAAVASCMPGASLDEVVDEDLSALYAKLAEDPALSWASQGAGRWMRSQSVFEDVVKTICTTNCAWSATVRMVDALVTHLGDPAIGGDGPLNRDRLAARRKAHEDGAWVRDAALAYAEKRRQRTVLQAAE